VPSGCPLPTTFSLLSHSLTMWACQIDWTAVGTIALAIATFGSVIIMLKTLRVFQKSTNAVERQASAIEESNRLMMKQREDSMVTAKLVVQSSIDSALDNIEEWEGRIKALEGSHVPLPSTIDLVPLDAPSAVYHAIHISPELPPLLSGAFHKLEYAQRDIRIILDSGQIITSQVRNRIDSALDFMEMAKAELNEAKKHLLKPPISSKKNFD
jgi:hypothetical protein